MKHRLMRCDLLENYYLCSINNSLRFNRVVIFSVVICLKTTTFVVSTTVQDVRQLLNNPL